MGRENESRGAVSQERSKVQDGWIRVDGFSSNLERKLGNGIKEATGMSIATLHEKYYKHIRKLEWKRESRAQNETTMIRTPIQQPCASAILIRCRPLR